MWVLKYKLNKCLEINAPIEEVKYDYVRVFTEIVQFSLNRVVCHCETNHAWFYHDGFAFYIFFIFCNFIFHNIFNKPKKKFYWGPEDPNVHTILWIAITFLVTCCEFEERILTIGLVKSNWRSSMAKKMFTGMCLMSRIEIWISIFMFSNVFCCRIILFSKKPIYELKM